MQGEKIERAPEIKSDGGKAGWMNERSLSSILKHSCLLCWSSSPRDTGVVETDERVLAKTAEIRVRRPQHLALVCATVCVSVCSPNCVCMGMLAWRVGCVVGVHVTACRVPCT